MCPRPKILGCCIPWTKFPLANLPLTEPSHPFDLIERSDTRLPTAARLVLQSGGVLCEGRACIQRRGANSINLVRGVGKAGQTPNWSIRRRRPTMAAIAADGASSMLDAVQGRDTSVRETISKGRFVQGAQHPRTFGRGHISRGHINPACKACPNLCQCGRSPWKPTAHTWRGSGQCAHRVLTPSSPFL